MPELQRQSGKADINIEDGIHYTLTAFYKIDGVIQDISNFTASFNLLDSVGHSDPLLTLTESSGVDITGLAGKVVVNITDSQSIYGGREMRYDLIITPPGGDDVHLLRGKCKSWPSGA